MGVKDNFKFGYFPQDGLYQLASCNDYNYAQGIVVFRKRIGASFDYFVAVGGAYMAVKAIFGSLNYSYYKDDEGIYIRVQTTDSVLYYSGYKPRLSDKDYTTMEKISL